MSHNTTRLQLAAANPTNGDENRVVTREDLPASASIEDSNSDCEDVEGPRVEAHVCLARTRRKLLCLVQPCNSITGIFCIERKRARTVAALADELNIPDLPELVRTFLFGQLFPDDDRNPADVSPLECPKYQGKIYVYSSASSTFYAPSDLSGIGGMRREYIRATPTWRQDGPRYDCVFVITNPELDGMRGMDVARILCFFSFRTHRKLHRCAVVHWFDRIGDAADEVTGMWMVRPSFAWGEQPNTAVIHIDAIFRAAHLIPVYDRNFVSPEIGPHNSYDSFRHFYVNKFADHHSFEIVY